MCYDWAASISFLRLAPLHNCARSRTISGTLGSKNTLFRQCLWRKKFPTFFNAHLSSGDFDTSSGSVPLHMLGAVLGIRSSAGRHQNSKQSTSQFERCKRCPSAAQLSTLRQLLSKLGLLRPPQQARIILHSFCYSFTTTSKRINIAQNSTCLSLAFDLCSTFISSTKFLARFKNVAFRELRICIKDMCRHESPQSLASWSSSMIHLLSSLFSKRQSISDQRNVVEMQTLSIAIAPCSESREQLIIHEANKCDSIGEIQDERP